MRVKAMRCHAFGPPESLVCDEIDLPAPGPGEALVRIRRIGVNFPDSLIIQGGYQFKPPFPFIPGLEVAGEIIEARSADGEALPVFARPGSAVMAGMRTGAYAEAAIVPIANLRAIPRDFTMSQAAAFRVAAHTAYVALVERGRLEAGETVLVLGAGSGVGLAAVQLAQARGATVIATASSPEKRDAAIGAGAAHALAATPDLKEQVLALTHGHGTDIVYDPVGGDAFDEAIRTLKWGGRHLVIGFAAGRIPTLQVNRALIKGLSVIGIRAGEYVRQNPAAGPRIQAAIAAHADAGQLTPRIHAELPLAEAPRALRMLGDRAVVGRLVLVP